MTTSEIITSQFFSIANDEAVKVILLGEWENKSPERLIYANALRALAETGFTHLALEWHLGLTDALFDFAQNNGSVEDLQEALKEHRYFEQSYFPDGEIDPETGIIPQHPEPMFFELLESARRAGLQMFPSDETETATGFEYRDKFMANRILTILDDIPGSRVILFGGFKHHYFRREKGQFRTVCELLADRLGRAAVVSILPDYIEGTDAPALINADGSAYANHQMADEYRCSFGSCDKFRKYLKREVKTECKLKLTDKCTGRHDLRVKVTKDCWDYLLLIPMTFDDGDV